MDIQYNFISTNLIENFNIISNEIIENLKNNISNYNNKFLLINPCNIKINYIIEPLNKISNKEKLKHLNTYKKIKKNDNHEKCSICLNNYKIGEFKRDLFCNHFFHKKCIDKWLLKCNKMSCPLCKKSNLPKNIEFKNDNLLVNDFINTLDNLFNIN